MCVCVLLAPRLYRPCHITGTDELQWWRERGCVHVMDHCSRARRCRFSPWHFFYSPSISLASWSEVVLRQLSAACEFIPSTFSAGGFYFQSAVWRQILPSFLDYLVCIPRRRCQGCKASLVNCSWPLTLKLWINTCKQYRWLDSTFSETNYTTLRIC